MTPDGHTAHLRDTEGVSVVHKHIVQYNVVLAGLGSKEFHVTGFMNQETKKGHYSLKVT